MAIGSSGTGQGGKSMQDRELAARVRSLALSEIEKVLKRKKGKLYEAVLIKLAGTVLPRLNEHSGPEGTPIPLLYALSDNNSNKKDIGASEEN